jgi:VanZ family protein
MRLWAPVVLYMAAIFFASSLQQPPIRTDSDKPLHGIAYSGLAVVILRALAGGLPRRVGMRAAVVTFAMTVGYACTDELHQMFVPGRSAEVNDLLADAIGALGGIAACWAWSIISAASRNEL